MKIRVFHDDGRTIGKTTATLVHGKNHQTFVYSITTEDLPNVTISFSVLQKRKLYQKDKVIGI